MINYIYTLLSILVVGNNEVYCLTDNVVDLTIASTVINRINDKYLSIALDTIVIAEKFKGFNMTNERLIKTTSYLSPGYLRIGGNLADRLYFVEDPKEDTTVPDTRTITLCDVDYCGRNLSNFTMTGSEWMKLNRFAADTGFRIIFDLNCLIRNDDGSWNSKNAEELIEFSDRNEYDLHFQLGNEPNAFRHMFNVSVNATQLADDFGVLKTILRKYPRYKNSLVIGPDTTRPEHNASVVYLKTFLNGTKKGVIDVVGWHQYYLNGRTATVNDFLNPNTFNLLEGQIKKIVEIVNVTGFDTTPVWLTETGTAYGGGAPGLSNTFIGSFLWIDKLGVSAKFGLKSVVRQTLFHGHYALIDNDYNPSPDWWISYIYKKYVGSEVLSCGLSDLKTTRLYCHCARRASDTPLNSSAVIVYGSNIDDDFVRVRINGIESRSKIVFSYVFKSELQSKDVSLNGEVMKLSKNQNVPFYSPEVFDFDSGLTIPPHSIVFWMIPSDNLCDTPDISVVQI